MRAFTVRGAGVRAGRGGALRTCVCAARVVSAVSAAIGLGVGEVTVAGTPGALVGAGDVTTGGVAGVGSGIVASAGVAAAGVAGEDAAPVATSGGGVAGAASGWKNRLSVIGIVNSKP